MAGFTVQNVMSAVGLAVAVALIRGILADQAERLGNFWVDPRRGPHPPPPVVRRRDSAGGGRCRDVAALRPGRADGGRDAVHDPARARRVAGGDQGVRDEWRRVFNTNSAHPFENPNALTNLFEIFLLLVLPVSLTRTFGTMVGDRRQGVVLVAVMGAIWAAFLAIA